VTKFVAISFNGSRQFCGARNQR